MRSRFYSRWGYFWLPSGNCPKGCRLGWIREADDKGRSFRGEVVLTQNFTAMFADNAVANTQSQASTFADVFGGKERIENTFGIDDADAVIAKRNVDE